MMRRNSRQFDRRAGFTLVEMLIAVSIIVIAAGLVFPAIQSMQRAAGTAAGRNTVSLGVDIARAWAVKQRADLGTNKLNVPNAEYSGTAAIYTPRAADDAYPDGSVLIVENFQRAKASGGISGTTNGHFEEAGLNGYRRIGDVDPIDLPNDTAVAGITYDGNENEAVYVTPPFAITFNEYGNLVNRSFKGSVNSGTGNDPEDFNYVQPIYYQWPDVAGNYSTNDFTIGTDTAEIPVVTGIFVYDNKAWTPEDDRFYEDDMPDDLESISAKPMFFSPHSGVQIRNERDD